MRRFSLCLIVGAVLVQLGPDIAYAQSGGSGGVATKENLDLPFDAIGDSEEEEDVPEIIMFYGQQYEGDGVFFCCDKSGSMSGTKWKRLQNEVVKNINTFSERVQFGIVFFDKGLAKFPTSGRPADANQAMKAAAIAMVMSTVTGHGTCTKPALIQSLQYANQSTSKRKNIIYLGDGRNTCDGDEDQYAKNSLAETTARNTQRVKINVICIGPADGSCNETWARQLAAQNNGKYTRLVQ